MCGRAWNSIAASAAEAGVNLEVRVRTSATAYEGILAEAEADRPSLIVMGRKGSTRLSRLLMGSVTRRVIGLSPCSVLIVPRDAVLNLKRILLAHDGSEYGEAAWREVIYLAKLAKSEVVVVSVARDDRQEIDCKLVLQHLKASAERHGIPLQSVFLKGRPFEKIIETAKEERGRPGGNGEPRAHRFCPTFYGECNRAGHRYGGLSGAGGQKKARRGSQRKMICVGQVRPRRAAGGIFKGKGLLRKSHARPPLSPSSACPSPEMAGDPVVRGGFP